MTRAPAISETADKRVLARLAVIVAAHFAVDAYAVFVPSLQGVLEVRCDLTTGQTAWLLGLGSLCAGVAQPLCAWVTDRIDTRIFGFLGLFLAAACLSCLGLADSFGTLLPFLVVGMAAVGAFHPIAASSAGQLSAQLPGQKRSLGMAIFFVGGMAGMMLGAIVVTRVAARPDGFDLMRWFMIPGILVAVALHLAVRRVPHRAAAHAEIAFTREEIRRRWSMMGLLYANSVLRTCVHVAMAYLYMRWLQHSLSSVHADWNRDDVAAAAAPLLGNMNAFTVLGMAIGGLATGALVRPGRERWPMVLLPVMSCPALVLIPQTCVEVAYALAVLAGVGVGGVVPIALSLAQRLLPHRTSLASGILLGGAWIVGALGPVLADWCLSPDGLDLSLPTTYTIFAGVLCVAGLLCLPLETDAVDRADR